MYNMEVVTTVTAGVLEKKTVSTKQPQTAYGLTASLSATTHGLARPRHLAALSDWLAVPVLHRHLCISAYGPLCANMTSSIKPEVQRRQRRTESQS